jgi:hypothetical protein
MKGGSGLRIVEAALRDLQRAVKGAVREVNQEAAELLAAGKYPRAEALMVLAKGARAFQADVTALRGRWREVRRGGRRSSAARQDETPLWELYRPILLALCDLGGEARRLDIERRLTTSMNGRWKAGDVALNPRGVPRWRVTVGRARRALVREGWLEDTGGLTWRITAAGRRTAGAEEVVP